MIGEPRNRRRALCGLFLAAGCATLAPHALAGSASWAAANNGNWNAAANWSPATVPNAAADNGTLSVTGGAYTVTLNTSQTVNTLAVSSANATLSHSAGTFTASTINVSGGTYTLSGGTVSGATIATSGSGTFAFANNGGNAFANNTTLIGNLFMQTGRLRLLTGSSFSGSSGTITSNSVLGFEQTGTLTGKTITIDNNAILSIDGSNTLTLASNSTVRGGNGGAFGQVFNIGGASGLINNGTVTTTGGVFSLNPLTLTNNGTVASTTGSRLLIRCPTSFSNAGTVQVTGGGSFTINLFESFPWTNTSTGVIRVGDATSAGFLAGNWSNAGTMIVNGGTLSLDGTFTRGGIGVITRTGGSIDIAGFMDNSGGTLLLNATTGDYRMNGGVVSGGTINSSGGGTMLFANNGNNRFANNVTYVGDLILNNGRIRLSTGASFTGASGTFTNNSVFGYEQTATLSGRTITVDNGSLFAIEGSNTLTLASNTMVRGGNSSAFGQTFSIGGPNGLINNGTISATSGNLQINPQNLTNNALMVANGGARMQLRVTGTFNNAGTLQATGGGSFTVNVNEVFPWTNTSTGIIRVADATSAGFLAGNWSNSGTMVVNGGTLSLDGTFTRGGIGVINRTGGSVDIAGFMDNTGGTLLLNTTTGDYRMNGGVINGGTINSSGGGTMLFANNGNNRFASNAVFVGNLSLNGGRIRLQSGSSFTGGIGSITNFSVFSYEQTGTLSGKTFTVLSSTFAVEGGNTLTLAADSSIRGGASNVGLPFAIGGVSRLINNGTIGANVSGQTVIVNPTNLNNNGTLEAVGGGRLNVPVTTNLDGNVGRLRADGPGSILNIQGGTYTISLPASATNGALISLQGTFTKAATFDASGKIIFDYAVAAPTPYAQIRSEVISGFNGGLWNGPGINSSAAAVTPRTAVGYAEASAAVGTMGGAFSTVSVDATAVLVRYTLAGDFNLNGTVNIDDFGVLAANFNQPRDWVAGDSNYDGTTNIDDFGLLASNFNQSLAGDTPLPRLVAPEPVAAWALMAASLSCRRIRQRKSPEK